MIALSPSRVHRPAPNYLLDDMASGQRGHARDEAAVWLRGIKKRDPLAYRAVARRHPVLSTWQIDQRKAAEEELDAQVRGYDGAPVTVATRQIFRDWQRVAETAC